MTNREIIIHAIIHNQEHFKNSTKEFTKQMNDLLTKEKNEFHHDIVEQYKGLVKGVIGDELTKRLAIPIEEVLIVLEDINLLEYLK